MRHFLFCAVLACLLLSLTAQFRSALCQSTVLPKQVRVAAEWEPTTGVLIAWPLRLPRELVIDLAGDVDLYVTVNTFWNEIKARETFDSWRIDPKRVHFILTRQGDGFYLTRDWGPFAVFDARGFCRLVDGLYFDYPLSGFEGGKRLYSVGKLTLRNYRPDDVAPGAVAEALGLPRTELPICLTGGNVAFDGCGTAFATQMMIDDNLSHGISKDQFLARLSNDLGVTRFHVVPNFERFGIQHLDCLMKMLDEERILIRRVPADHPDFEHVEEAVRFLSQLTNVHNRPYSISRIDTPPYFRHLLSNYTNALILNRKVYVPLFDIPSDRAAIKTWQAAMPSHTVIGIRYEGWNFTDSIHCRVRGIWDTQMLRMTHKRLEGVVPWTNRYVVECGIRACDHRGLVDDQLLLMWRRRGGSNWTQVCLKSMGSDAFRAEIVGVQPGQTVEYYLSAASRGGRRESLPRTAPAGFYSFTAAAGK
jgi:agmatine/peptidylarginine deiminase